MPTFRFNEADHSYFLGDRRLESVTEILGDAGMIDRSWFTEEARTRGTYVHQATEGIDKGTLDWNALDPILLPYCRAYEKFVADARPEIILSEKPMYHATHLYAGKPDRIQKVNGITGAWDIKSGSPVPATGLQLAAYRELVKVNEDIVCSKCFGLYLQDDGNYRVHEYPNHQRNLNTFLAALTTVRWRKENL
jgi:hypothetical protein